MEKRKEQAGEVEDGESGDFIFLLCVMEFIVIIPRLCFHVIHLISLFSAGCHSHLILFASIYFGNLLVMVNYLSSQCH